MKAVATEELLSATLLSASDSECGVALPEIVDTIAGDGNGLSSQLEVAVAVEKLVDRGLVSRQSSDGTEQLSLTADGHSVAERITAELATQHIEVVDGDGRRELSLAQAAEELDRSVVELAAECSETGVYYTRDRIDTDGIVDRESQQTEFASLLDRVERTGDGATVRLVGTGGNGKTALARAMFEQTAETVESCETSSRAAETEPYQPIRDLLSQVGNDDLFETKGIEIEDTESYERQQTGLFREITERLTPESGVRVLFFDDVNHADAATWEYLGFLRENLSGRSLVVVFAHRPGTLLEDAPIHPESGAADLCLEVTGLDRDETRQLIEQVVGRRGVPTAFADAVHERTGGAPLFVEATVQALLDTDQLDPQFQWYPTDPASFELPDAVTETIQKQAATLEDTVRDVLEWVAAARGSVPVSLLSAVTAASPERVTTVIETVSQMRLLRRTTRAGEAHVTFQNEVFGDALLDRLDDADRAARHERLANRYEKRVTDQDDGHAGSDRVSTVAYHYAESGDIEGAIEWYGTAADRATDVYAHETAIEYYYRVIDLARQADETATVLDANERLADIYTITGEYDQASKHIHFVRQRIDEDSDRRQRLAGLTARIHNARGEFDDAIDVATAALNQADPSPERGKLLGVLAEAYLKQGEFDEAAETASRQRKLATELDDTRLEADALRNLGVSVGKQGEYEQAETSLADALDLFQSVGDRQAAADCLQGLGDTCYRNGAYDEGREYLEQARDIRAEIGDRQGLARSLWGIGRTEIMQGEYDKAEESNERALDIFREIGDRQGEGDTLNNIGVIMFRRREYDRTREYLDAALEARQETGNQEGVANILNNLGNAATLQGEYDSAREYFEQALPIHREIGHPYGEAMCLRNIGNIVQFRGEYERAREYYEDALEITRETDTMRIEAICLNDLGNVARLRGEYEQAREYYEESLSVKREIGERHGEAETLHDRGLLACQCGETDSARADYDQSRELASELDDPRREALALRGLSVLARRQADTDSASEYLDQAVALVDKGTDYPEVGKLELEAGRLALARGDTASARDAAEQARAIFAGQEQPLWVGRSRRLLGDIACENGETATAREHWTAAVDTFETIGAPAETLRTLEALIEACLEQDDDEAARESYQRARRLLADAPDPIENAHGGLLEQYADREELGE